MAYEQKDNTLQAKLQPDNINTKFPAISASMTVNGNTFKTAAWVRSNEKYGYQISVADSIQFITFVKACLGSGIAPKVTVENNNTEEKVPEKEEDKQQTLNLDVKDDLHDEF